MSVLVVSGGEGSFGRARGALTARLACQESRRSRNELAAQPGQPETPSVCVYMCLSLRLYRCRNPREYFKIFDSVKEVLSYVQYNPEELLRSMRKMVDKALRENKINNEESRTLLRFYEQGLEGYTYLE